MADDDVDEPSSELASRVSRQSIKAAWALALVAAVAAATPPGKMPAAAAAAVLDQAPAESDELHSWLVGEARLSPRVAAKVGKVLEVEDVETVDNLLWFATLPRFEGCGISALAADMIRAAIAGRSGPAAVADSGSSFTTPTSARLPQKTRAARASKLSSPPVRTLFASTEAGSTHYDGGPTAGEPARPQSAAGASLEAAAALTAGTVAIEVLPTSGRSELELTATTALQAAARGRRARSQLRAAVVAVVRVQAAARGSEARERRDWLRGQAAAARRGFHACVSAGLEGILRDDCACAANNIQRFVRLVQYGDCFGPLVPPSFWTTNDSIEEVELTGGLSVEQQAACEGVDTFSTDQLHALDLPAAAAEKAKSAKATEAEAGEQRAGARRPMAGRNVPSLAAGSELSDGRAISSITDTASGLAASLPSQAPSRTASAPRGAAEPAAAPAGFQPAALTSVAPFVLRAGPLPDAHLPYDFRYGRRMYETLGLYDRWLRGAALQVDEWDEGHLDDGEAQGEAGRVTHTLWYFLTDRLDEPRLDASRPAAAQHAEFARLGWDSSPPKAGELMRLMVRSAELSYNAERRRCSHGPVHAQTQRDYFNTRDSRSWLKGAHESDDEADIDRDAIELDAYASRASKWACY